MTEHANPGSARAKRLGCTCPALDNAYGEGAVIDGISDPNQFFIADDCPIHVDKRKLTEENATTTDPEGTS